jgi:hypothetical protein
MASLSQLHALLWTDSRIHSSHIVQGNIIIGKGDAWPAKFWIYNFVVEHLEGWVRASNESLAAQFLSVRLPEGSGQLDLQALDTSIFRLLMPAVDFMSGRYGDGLGREAVDAGIYPELGSSISNLSHLIYADERAGGWVYPSPEQSQ